MNTSKVPSSAFFENNIFPLQEVEHSRCSTLPDQRGNEQSFPKWVCLFPVKEAFDPNVGVVSLESTQLSQNYRGLHKCKELYREDVEGRTLQGVWWRGGSILFRISSSTRAPSPSCVGTPHLYQTPGTLASL